MGACHHSFSCVATNITMGAHASKPIAFILSDFHFLTDNDIIILPLDSLLKPSAIKELQICFCFDKSPINGCWQKFHWMGHHYLCPVLAGLLIVQAMLHSALHSTTEPLGAYQWVPTNKCTHTYTFLCTDEVIKIMQDLVAMAHPDPNHYLQQLSHLCCINCHSTQVMACVALSEGNALIKQIAHKL